MVHVLVDSSDASQRPGPGQVYGVGLKEQCKAVILLEKAIATMIPNYLRPKVLVEYPVGRTASEAESPEHSVVVYEAG